MLELEARVWAQVLSSTTNCATSALGLGTRHDDERGKFSFAFGHHTSTRFSVPRVEIRDMFPRANLNKQN